MGTRIKLLSRDLTSYCPARAYCEDRKIAGPLRYEPGKWVESLPGSLGIFLFEVDEAHLKEFLKRWRYRTRVFECEAERVRPILVVLAPNCSPRINLSRGDLMALRRQSASLLAAEAFQPAPRGVGYRTVAAQRIRLIRELG